MIFDDAVDEVKETEQEPEKIVILATVTSLTSGKALVKFNGETEPATKAYPYIEGYKPAVNDVVCMLKQGNTFVIIGKVSNSDITTNYAVFSAELATILANYLLSSTAESTYLSQTDATSTYLKQTDATSTYLKQTDAASTYLSQTDATSTYLKQTDATSTYLKQTDAATTYVKKTDDISVIKNGSRSLTLNSSGVLTPDSQNNISIGTSSVYLAHVHSKEYHGQYWRQNGQTTGGLELINNTLRPVSPGTTHGISLGQSNQQFENIYGKNIYVNGSPVSTSDKRKKKTIKDIARKYKELFFRLCPVSYKFKDGTSGRTHTGFIAQEVEQAAADVGIELKDLGAVVIDSDGFYGLRYEEFVPILTAVVQDQQKQINNLTDRIHDLERVIYK